LAFAGLDQPQVIVCEATALDAQIDGALGTGGYLVRGLQLAPQLDHPATLLVLALPWYVVSGRISGSSSHHVAPLPPTMLPLNSTCQFTFHEVGFM